MEGYGHGLIHGTMLVSHLREAEGKKKKKKNLKVWIATLQLRNKPVTMRNRSNSNFTMSVFTIKVCI